MKIRPVGAAEVFHADGQQTSVKYTNLSLHDSKPLPRPHAAFAVCVFSYFTALWLVPWVRL